MTDNQNSSYDAPPQDLNNKLVYVWFSLTEPVFHQFPFSCKQMDSKFLKLMSKKWIILSKSRFMSNHAHQWQLVQ